MPIHKHSVVELAADSAQGHRIPVYIERRHGMRNMRLSVSYDGRVIVRAPFGVREKELAAFVRNHRDWVESNLQQIAAGPSLLEYLSLRPELNWLGQLLPMKMEASYRYMLRHVEGVISEPGHLHLRYLVNDIDQESRLKGLLIKGAARTLPQRVQYWQEKHSLSLSRVSIRDQRGRWGSCSSQGTVSLNWRLILLPPALQDSIILHELAHLTHLNHSAKFWDLLEYYDPAYLQHEKAVNEQYASVMMLGRS